MHFEINRLEQLLNFTELLKQNKFQMSSRQRVSKKMLIIQRILFFSNLLKGFS